MRSVERARSYLRTLHFYEKHFPSHPRQVYLLSDRRCADETALADLSGAGFLKGEPMKHLKDYECKLRWDALKQRQKADVARLVYESCCHREIKEVARLLEQTVNWVHQHLECYAVVFAQGGYHCPNEAAKRPVLQTDREEIRRVMQYAPNKPDGDYVAGREGEGFTQEVARILALAYEATENALEAGVIQDVFEKKKKGGK